MLETLIKQSSFTKKEKLTFAHQCMEAYGALGYKGEVDESRLGMKKVYNIMIGNFKTAKHIIVVPYDNPKKVFWPKYTMYTQSGTYSLKKNFMPYYTPMIVCYFLLLAIVYGLPNVLGDVGTNFISGFAVVYLVLLALMVFRGFANRHNAVSRDGALQVAYALASSLSSSKRKEIAFVFTDQNSFKMQGSEALEKYLANIHRNPSKIVLYCIGQGDTLGMSYRKGSRKLTQDLLKRYKGNCQVVSKGLEVSESIQLPLDHLNNALMIGNGSMNHEHLCVQNVCTSKDKQNEQVLIDEIKDMLLAYLK